MTPKQRAIGAMLDRNQGIISAAYGRGWTLAEIAATLRVGERTVGRRLKRWGVAMRRTGSEARRRGAK